MSIQAIEAAKARGQGPDQFIADAIAFYIKTNPEGAPQSPVLSKTLKNRERNKAIKEKEEYGRTVKMPFMALAHKKRELALLEQDPPYMIDKHQNEILVPKRANVGQLIEACKDVIAEAEAAIEEREAPRS